MNTGYWPLRRARSWSKRTAIPGRTTAGCILTADIGFPTKSDYTLAQGHETRVYGYTYIFDVGVKTNVLDIGVVANGFDVSENYLIEYDYGFLEIVESDYEGPGRLRTR